MEEKVESPRISGVEGEKFRICEKKPESRVESENVED
jgi:hypothetical protein